MREHLNILTLGLGDIVALLLILSAAFLSGVIHRAAALRVLGPALLLVLSLLKTRVFHPRYLKPKSISTSTGLLTVLHCLS